MTDKQVVTGHIIKRNGKEMFKGYGFILRNNVKQIYNGSKTKIPSMTM